LITGEVQKSEIKIQLSHAPDIKD